MLHQRPVARISGLCHNSQEIVSASQSQNVHTITHRSDLFGIFPENGNYLPAIVIVDKNIAIMMSWRIRRIPIHK